VAILFAFSRLVLPESRFWPAHTRTLVRVGSRQCRLVVLPACRVKHKHLLAILCHAFLVEIILTTLYRHPDKVTLTEGQTKEDAEGIFIEITKAYKALTNEDIRKNWEEFGHPDGKQDFRMGLAIPPWVVAAQNNIWILMVYGLLFGAGLPYLVGRWWFGSRQRTKDGVENRTAEQFFKAVRDDSGAGEFIAQMAEAWPREGHAVLVPELKSDVGLLRDKIDKAIGQDWRSKTDEPVAERALVLIYAHLLRIPVKRQQLADEQRRLLLHTPTLLTSLLSMTLSHSWLGPSLTVLHLHALLAQAMMPDAEKLTVFAGVDKATADLAGHDLKELVTVLEKKKSPEVAVVRAAGERWGKLEMAGAAYRVIGEKTVTPSAIMQLVFKLRIAPPLVDTSGVPVATEDPAEEAAADEAFISGKKDAEDLPAGVQRSGWAHAPYWPANRKPSWWAVLADVRTGKVVVPPMRFTDVPISDPTRKRNYRTYKMQIQAPPQVGMFPWRLLIFSDTYVGEDVGRDLPVSIALSHFCRAYSDLCCSCGLKRFLRRQLRRSRRTRSRTRMRIPSPARWQRCAVAKSRRATRTTATPAPTPTATMRPTAHPTVTATECTFVDLSCFCINDLYSSAGGHAPLCDT